MKLIVGLGNPGSEYTNTRHNVGFLVLDALAERWGAHFVAQKKLKSELLVTMQNGETVLLAKPQIFMNDSGRAIQKIKAFYKLDNADIWIVSDDIDLEFGILRTRTGGSSGGHNGLKDTIEQIGETFVRIRCGVKNESLEKTPAEKFVLQNFSKSEQNKLPEIITRLVDTIEESLQNDIIVHTSSATQ